MPVPQCQCGSQHILGYLKISAIALSRGCFSTQNPPDRLSAGLSAGPTGELTALPRPHLNWGTGSRDSGGYKEKGDKGKEKMDKA